MTVLTWKNPHWFKQFLTLIKREHSEKETIKGIYGIKKNTICLFAYILNEKRDSMLLIYMKKETLFAYKKREKIDKREKHTYLYAIWQKREKKEKLIYCCTLNEKKNTKLLILIDIIN